MCRARLAESLEMIHFLTKIQLPIVGRTQIMRVDEEIALVADTKNEKKCFEQSIGECFASSGIYRQAGLESKIKQLLFECLDDPFTTSLNRDNYTEHDVASALKRFLRQLETPLLGSRHNYQAWLRSTVDKTLTSDYLIPYYRALLKDLKQHSPIHYATLRTMLVHIHTVAMVADTNGMTLSNLVSTFAPCLISQTTPTSIHWNNVINGRERKMSLDAIDMENARQSTDEEPVDRTASPSVTKLKRNQSFHCKHNDNQWLTST